MTMTFKKLTASLAMTAAAVVLGSSLALAALSLDAAKAQGIVGEKPDGLVGVVQSSAEADSLAASINAERLAKYKDIAAKNGTALPQVQALAGKKLIEATPAGQYIMTASGSWQKK